MLVIRTLAKAKADLGPEYELMGSTKDLKAAYRQMQLLTDQEKFAITMVWNHYESQVDFHEMYGQPFGAGHAVPNFCRLASWAVGGARRLLHLVINYFFDVAKAYHHISSLVLQ